MAETVFNRNATYLHIYAVVLTLALLPGCATVHTAQTEPAIIASDASCTSDTDTFCVEGKKDSAARLNRQGLAYAEEKNNDQALDSFKQAVELDNSNPEFYYNLGVAYWLKQMPLEAEAAYIQGLAIKPGDPRHTLHFANIHFNLACIYALQGKKDQAFEQLEKLYAVNKKLLYHWVEGDADLASLRDDPRYKEILARQAGNSSQPEAADKLEEPGKSN